jgi:hypothetical protein
MRDELRRVPVIINIRSKTEAPKRRFKDKHNRNIIFLPFSHLDTCRHRPSFNNHLTYEYSWERVSLLSKDNTLTNSIFTMADDATTFTVFRTYDAKKQEVSNTTDCTLLSRLHVVGN